MNDTEQYRLFDEAVYKHDPQFPSYGLIQWKGTDVCMDVHCSCGHHSHIDSEFCYYVQCSKCGAKYATSPVVKLIPLTTEQAEYAATRHDFRIDTEPLDT